MRSIKISDKSNTKVVELSEKFHMSKQSFVSMVLENINLYECQGLLNRELTEDEYPDNEDLNFKQKISTFPPLNDYLSEPIDEPLLTLETTDEDLGEDKIDGL